VDGSSEAPVPSRRSPSYPTNPPKSAILVAASVVARTRAPSLGSRCPCWPLACVPFPPRPLGARRRRHPTDVVLPAVPGGVRPAQAPWDGPDGARLCLGRSLSGPLLPVARSPGMQRVHGFAGGGRLSWMCRGTAVPWRNPFSGQVRATMAVLLSTVYLAGGVVWVLHLPPACF
jgi:hypothetical protein